MREYCTVSALTEKIEVLWKCLIIFQKRYHILGTLSKRLYVQSTANLKCLKKRGFRRKRKEKCILIHMHHRHLLTPLMWTSECDMHTYTINVSTILKKPKSTTPSSFNSFLFSLLTALFIVLNLKQKERWGGGGGVIFKNHSVTLDRFRKLHRDEVRIGRGLPSALNLFDDIGCETFPR